MEKEIKDCKVTLGDRHIVGDVAIYEIDTEYAGLVAEVIEGMIGLYARQLDKIPEKHKLRFETVVNGKLMTVESPEDTKETVRHRWDCNEARRYYEKKMPEKSTNRMVEETTWKEFADAGLLFYINQILHGFGMVIVLDLDEDGNVTRAYPATTKFRGFSGDTIDRGYKKLANFIKDNADRIVKDTEE